MDAARLQQLVYRGYAIAAKNIGPLYDHYRPAGTGNPLAAPNKLGTLNASFAPRSNQFSYGMPSSHASPLYHGLFDGTQVAVGDYFSRSGETFFVASLDPIVPPLCVGTNRTVTIVRPQALSAVGLGSYGGNVAGVTETTLISGWPASLLLSGGGPGGPLPGDGGSDRWSVMLPPIPGVVFRPSDLMTCDLGRRYLISGAEVQDYGWRLNASQQVT